MRHGEPFEIPLVRQDVHSAPVRDRRHGKVGDRLERRQILERRPEDQANFREEGRPLARSFLLGNVPCDLRGPDDVAGLVANR
jgi:hypothetical protein